MRILYVFAAATLMFFAGTEVARAQPRWVQRFPAHNPGGPRLAHAMAYDSARGRVVLFGGTFGTGFYSDTWEWDGTDWEQKNPSRSPRGRSGHAMAFDSARGRVVLFGGYDFSFVMADTWEWDGVNWVERNVALRPPRAGHAMAYDSIRGKTVLFGGQNGSILLADIWEWDGTNWTQRFVPGFPSARTGHIMAYDSVRGRTVLFGGEDSAGVRSDTWEWDGTDWMQRSPATNPPTRTFHAAVYDSILQRTALFGGRNYSGNVFFDTWEWDGNNWVQTAIEPNCAWRIAPRAQHAMAYDIVRAKTLLFGGSDGQTHFSDTWEYGLFAAGPCFNIGRGHCTGSLAISCATQPTIGTLFILTFNNPGNAAGFGLLYAGARLAPPLNYGPPGLCDAGFIYALPWLIWQSFGNPTSFAFQIPDEPTLAGQSVAIQGASFEFTGCFRLTDGLLVTFQAP